ncbi:MAG: butyrate kinase [Fermentimonas sp.]|jgi:butyrate kinase|nr:butyrate kinase [Fermentimonas sp.]HBT86726.1 butyrate kinase [Porphyromonadaceae bacterium]MDD2930795.1 butyrate kinase [Fermentimonas sp.]MDD3189032.1 butyrate kinase [Fermentimonas sp.]MDD3511791.1 butyrate kinase [Fermentimonas sp.]
MATNTRILVINPGSTSTKIAIYQQEKVIFLKTIKHAPEDLRKYKRITDQYEFRKDVIYKELQSADVPVETIDAVIGRGGMVKPIASGVYRVNDAMRNDLLECKRGEHASNLGALIAADIAKMIPSAEAFIADPVVVDELQPLARYSGHPIFERKSVFHALNQKAIARSHAKSIMKKYEELNLIVVHLGGGITVGAHYKGKVIDVNQGLDGDGPFSPERSGSLPVGQLLKVAFSGIYSYDKMAEMIVGKGGMMAYLGTNDAYVAEREAKDGDKKYQEVLAAMAYQVAKEIGGMATVLKGEVDGILITGGIANSKWFCNMIIERVYRIAPVYVYPGQDEMGALAENALLALNGEIEIKEYI